MQISSNSWQTEREREGGRKKSNVNRKIHIKWPKTLLSRAEPNERTNAHPTSDKPNKFFKINYRVEQTNLHIYTERGRRQLGAVADKMFYFFLFTPQSKSRKFFESPHYPDRKMSYCTCCWWRRRRRGGRACGANEKSLEKLRLKVATLLIISRQRQRQMESKGSKKWAARRCQKKKKKLWG